MRALRHSRRHQLHGAAGHARHPAPQQCRRDLHQPLQVVDRGRRQPGLRRRRAVLVLPERHRQRLLRRSESPELRRRRGQLPGAGSTTPPTATARASTTWTSAPTTIPEIGFVQRRGFGRTFGSAALQPADARAAASCAATCSRPRSSTSSTATTTSSRAGSTAHFLTEWQNSDQFMFDVNAQLRAAAAAVPRRRRAWPSRAAATTSSTSPRATPSDSSGGCRARWRSQSGQFYDGDIQR